MKHLFIATAVIEAGAGVALMCVPSVTVALLLGSPLGTPSAVAVGRLAGIALFALAVANWFARDDGHSRAVRGLVGAMALYNLGAAVVLGASGIRSQPAAVALWPTVIVHAAMAGWCLTSLPRTPPHRGT